MDPQAKQAKPDSDRHPKITDDFSESTEEVTGVRKIKGVRQAVDSTLSYANEYSGFTARTEKLDKTPINNLPHRLEEQVDIWAREFVFKGRIVLDEDPERESAAVRTLNELQTKGKIRGFELSPEGEKKAYMIYFKYGKS